MINKNFFFLWLGKIISQMGDKFYAIALAWWILQKTNSPTAMGFFLVVSAFPAILIGFFAGALTDRCKRKNILIITDIMRGILVFLIWYLSLFQVLEVWHVFAIGIFLSMVTAFFEPAVQSIVPEMVEEKDLVKANGMSQMVGGITIVAGPLLGAFAVSAIGMKGVFFINGISYIISAVLSGFIQTEGYVRKTDASKNIWSEVMEGICFIKEQKQIFMILKIIALAHFFVGELSVVLPFLARQLGGDGVRNLGYLEMMLGLGLFGGSIFMGARKNSVVSIRKLLLYMTIFGMCLMAIGLERYLMAESVCFYLPMLMILGGCIAFASVSWQSLLQKYTPMHMTGRVFGISSLLGNISLPLSYGIFGVLLDISSIFLLMAFSGTVMLCLCFLLSLGFQKERQTERDKVG